MATYKSALQRREGELLFALAVSTIHIWAYVQMFRQMPSWLLRLSLGELFGAVSYTLTAALIESLLVAGLLLLAGRLPAAWFDWTKGRFAILLAALFLGIAIWAGVAATYYNDVKQMPGILLWLAGVALTLPTFAFLCLRIERLALTWQGLLERLPVLSNLYLFLDALAVFVVIARNVL